MEKELGTQSINSPKTAVSLKLSLDNDIKKKKKKDITVEKIAGREAEMQGQSVAKQQKKKVLRTKNLS